MPATCQAQAFILPWALVNLWTGRRKDSHRSKQKGTQRRSRAQNSYPARIVLLEPLGGDRTTTHGRPVLPGELPRHSWKEGRKFRPPSAPMHFSFPGLGPTFPNVNLHVVFGFMTRIDAGGLTQTITLVPVFWSSRPYYHLLSISR